MRKLSSAADKKVKEIKENNVLMKIKAF